MRAAFVQSGNGARPHVKYLQGCVLPPAPSARRLRRGTAGTRRYRGQPGRGRPLTPRAVRATPGPRRRRRSFPARGAAEPGAGWGTWADGGFPAAGGGGGGGGGWGEGGPERYSRRREAGGQRGAAAARLRGTPGISGAPGRGGGGAVAVVGRGGGLPGEAEPSGHAGGRRAGSGEPRRRGPAEPPAPGGRGGAPGRADGARRRSAGGAGGRGAAGGGKGWRAALRAGKGARRPAGAAGWRGGSGRGGEREREKERGRRGASQMHGIQKKQLSKALAGMQICRISGPIIPWHTKHAGGINVPKRGSQNKQQIEKKNQHNTTIL